ncbi:L-lactate dehydrogenase [Loigolactobacillus bifermentans]|jgi:L-lactate dehydrogenase|nr:L-lactate dehydrogenase [Loigolactobacillus bifermentans]
MNKVGIIGVGHVGSAAAHEIVVRGLCHHLVLIDDRDAKAKAECLDLKDMGAQTLSHTKISAQDYSLLSDADVVIFSTGAVDRQGPDRMQELNWTKQTVYDAIPKLMATGFNGVIVSITNPCDVIAALIQKVSGLPKNRVFGTGTSLDTARMKRVLSQTFNVNPKNIGGYVLGEHGDSQFTAWSTVSVAGIPLAEYPGTADLDLAQLTKEISAGGWAVHSGKGYTCYGISSCVSNIVKAILTDEVGAFPVSTYSDRYDTYIGRPAYIAGSGVVKPLPLNLTIDERTQLDQSAAKIRKSFLENAVVQAAQ